MRGKAVEGDSGDEIQEGLFGVTGGVLVQRRIMLVTTATVGFSLAKDPSLSSASTTIH